MFAAPVAYFALVCIGLALIRHPPRRRTFLAGGSARIHGIAAALQGRFRAAIRFVATGLGFVRYGGTGISIPLIENRPVAFSALVLALVPPLAVLALSQRAIFEFAPDDTPPDRKIAALLAGEHLAPPPPLPPAVFATTEVEMLRPSLGNASRDWNLLDGEFRQRLLTVFKLLEEQHGYQAVLLEGYRSPERQAELLLRGPSVTQAAPNLSYHQHGLAADVAFLRDGRLVISERDPWAMRGYEFYGVLAEAAGLTWGGRWKMMDLGHVELRRREALPAGRS
ncbi:M15 family metallopeptidase [Aromatoleum evansii]|uniref:M15 family metallopeptidase n=1 Tax=Aromatoleum evansii TaxID=59406 RepID=A0ABZ1AIE3_AROEV|nr:M15 family metallopeptidase [Aromatoleum evansii]